MDATAQYAQMNFNLPHDVVELPTRGIFYKSKKKSVKVGYLTANDENLITNAITNNKSRDNIALSLIRSKLYETDLKVEELLTGDVQAILLFLRNTSFGPEYNFSITDPVDNKKFEGTVLLDEVDLKKTKQEPNENGEFTTQLPRTGVSVTIRPMPLSEYFEIDRRVDAYPTGLIAPRTTWTLQQIITSIDGDKDKGKIVQFIESMPIMDSKYIRNFLEENEPSLDLRKEVYAPSGEKVVINIAFGVEFFRPFV